ncbi:hypothetical protein LCGC14_1474580 [marine sediment metagenome]|uniref:Uncharacterized protein n=1 Tax=marine sediment metagenome TaxID=412755 RepID=A0A0F9JC09_9ZZZZ
MDLEKVEKHIEIINSEMGELRDKVAEIRGELKWISKIIVATFLASVVQLISNFLG